jgi:hypothetical protein
MREKRNKMFAGPPSGSQFKEDVHRSNTFSRHDPYESLGVVDLSAQLFVGVRPAWQSMAVHAGAADGSGRKVQSGPDQLDEALSQMKVLRRVTDEKSNCLARQSCIPLAVALSG